MYQQKLLRSVNRRTSDKYRLVAKSAHAILNTRITSTKNGFRVRTCPRAIAGLYIHRGKVTNPTEHKYVHTPAGATELFTSSTRVEYEELLSLSLARDHLRVILASLPPNEN